MLFHVNTKKRIIYCNYNILQTYTAHLPRSLTSSVVQNIRPLFMFRLLGTFYLCPLAAHRRCICRYTSLRIVHVQRRRKRASFNATPHLDLPVPPRHPPSPPPPSSSEHFQRYPDNLPPISRGQEDYFMNMHRAVTHTYTCASNS